MWSDQGWSVRPSVADWAPGTGTESEPGSVRATEQGLGSCLGRPWVEALARKSLATMWDGDWETVLGMLWALQLEM